MAAVNKQTSFFTSEGFSLKFGTTGKKLVLMCKLFFSDIH